MFDFKKEYKEFYLPKNKPEIIAVPEMRFAAVCGRGDPNEPESEFKRAVGLLYSVAFTVKMSKRMGHSMDGYFEYVVPPLEGFWWMDGRSGIDYASKSEFCFRALIRLPDFVSTEDFEWAVNEAEKKKKADFSRVEYLVYNEGLCVQCMHIGPFDNEPETIALMDAFTETEGFALDFSDTRFHHEIYISDARKTAPERLRTVLRHPVRKK